MSIACYLNLHRFCLIRSITLSVGNIVDLTRLRTSCLSCIRCNSKKGPNIASVDPQTGHVVALFHPRQQMWSEHFVVATNGTIKGLTPEGRASVELLEMNDVDRVRLRLELIRRGQYP